MDGAIGWAKSKDKLVFQVDVLVVVAKFGKMFVTTKKTHLYINYLQGSGCTAAKK